MTICCGTFIIYKNYLSWVQNGYKHVYMCEYLVNIFMYKSKEIQESYLIIIASFFTSL